jgi:hypothetical protein
MLGSMFPRGRLRIICRGKDPDFAVSQHAIHVKEKQFDFFGPDFGHGGNIALGGI